MIDVICAWSYAAGDILARVSAALGMMAVAMVLTPVAMDAVQGVRRWRRARQER